MDAKARGVAPNPIAVLQSYVQGGRQLDDRWVQTLVRVGWLTNLGTLTELGQGMYREGWNYQRQNDERPS